MYVGAGQIGYLHGELLDQYVDLVAAGNGQVGVLRQRVGVQDVGDGYLAQHERVDAAAVSDLGYFQEELFALPAVRLTPAGRNRALIRMPGAYLLGFGPRTADAVMDLSAALRGVRGS